MKYRIVKGEAGIQRTKEWYDYRKGKITASMISSILGVDPYRTALQLWEDIVFDRKTDTTAAMQRGIDAEIPALEWMNRDREFKFEPVVIESVSYPWMMASLDGFNEGDTRFPYLLEIKCVKAEYHELCRSGEFPPPYYAQMQFQIFVADARGCNYLSWREDDPLVRYCTRNQEFIEDMIEKANAFRQAILNFKPPAPTDKDTIEVTDPGIKSRADRYIQLSKLADEIEFEREEIRAELIDAIHHPRATVGKLKVTKIIRAGTIDWYTIPEIKTVDLEKYRKSPNETWRLSYE